MCKKNIDTYPLDKVDMDRMNGIKKRCITLLKKIVPKLG